MFIVNETLLVAATLEACDAQSLNGALKLVSGTAGKLFPPIFLGFASAFWVTAPDMTNGCFDTASWNGNRREEWRGGWCRHFCLADVAALGDLCSVNSQVKACVNAPENKKRRKPITKDKKRRVGNVMSCIQGHHSSDIPSITLKKQNSVLTSRWRGATGRAAGEKGKLGNQMWSIKTYWHAKGLLLPHSHTWSTNSYSKPRCLCGHMHMSPWLHKTHTCSCMGSLGNTQLAGCRVCAVTRAKKKNLDK